MHIGSHMHDIREVIVYSTSSINYEKSGQGLELEMLTISYKVDDVFHIIWSEMTLDYRMTVER